MKTKTTLLILMAAALMCETLLAQTSYRRLTPGGLFQVPAFWTPFDPVNFPPYIGPGGANDNAVFDLGFNFFDTYTITNVGGVNDQLIVEDDSVRLEISDYELVSLGFGSEASIAVGQSTGDVGILILDGAAGSQLSSEGGDPAHRFIKFECYINHFRHQIESQSHQ